MKRVRMSWFVWLLLCAVVFSAGCVHEDEPPADSTLPWNRPASWEGKQLGIPL